MRPDSFKQLLAALENNPGAVKFDGNVADLPNGASVYCGSIVVMIDSGMCKVDLTPDQKDRLRTLLDYCRKQQKR